MRKCHLYAAQVQELLEVTEDVSLVLASVVQMTSLECYAELLESGTCPWLPLFRLVAFARLVSKDDGELKRSWIRAGAVLSILIWRHSRSVLAGRQRRSVG